MWRVAVTEKLIAHRVTIIAVGVGLVLCTTGIGAYYRYSDTHLPPATTINNTAIGNLSYEEANSKLASQFDSPPAGTITLGVEGIEVASSSSDLGLHYNYPQVLQSIKEKATKGNTQSRLTWKIKTLLIPQNYSVSLTYDENKLEQLVRTLNEKVAYQGIQPTVTLKVSGNENSIEVFAGKRGREVDITATKELIQTADPTKNLLIAAVVASTASELNQEEIDFATNRSKKFVDKSIDFTFDNKNYILNDKELVSFLHLPRGYDLDSVETKVATLAAKVNRKPQEPVFEFNKETLDVIKFSPPLNGQTLDTKKTAEQILEALEKLENRTALATDPESSTEISKEKLPIYELAVQTTPPEKSLGDTNNLGINERVGFGDSHYDHSIPNRIHNVAITTERVSNVIVPPGAEFSFNKTLGDVSAETGYRSAYVIKNGQTALGDGGGVCQVSTTLFRSVLNAGLKVTRRLPHSYRVSYYELDSKPGVDATVYSGETDFRFINDTGSHILIHGEADSKNLYMYMEIYGTSDGRTTEIKDHITWNARPAPAPQYFPDPTLPVGKLKQIDWAAPGINASFINVIKDKDGNVVREDKYVSNYRPWSAKYMQGTAQ